MVLVFFLWDGETLRNKGSIPEYCYLWAMKALSPLYYPSIPWEEATRLVSDGAKWGIHAIESDKIEIETLEALRCPGMSYLEAIRRYDGVEWVLDPVDGELLYEDDLRVKQRIRGGYSVMGSSVRENNIEALSTVTGRYSTLIPKAFSWMFKYGRKRTFFRTYKTYYNYRSGYEQFESLRIPGIDDPILFKKVIAKFYADATPEIIFDYIRCRNWCDTKKLRFYYVTCWVTYDRFQRRWDPLQGVMKFFTKRSERSYDNGLYKGLSTLLWGL